jgi:hypothetical protein
MEKHFVRFYSPGTFVAEVTEKPIDSWDVEKAKQLARDIKERYDAKPYGFRFVTYSRAADELDSHEAALSPLYYLGGKVETLEPWKWVAIVLGVVLLWLWPSIVLQIQVDNLTKRITAMEGHDDKR